MYTKRQLNLQSAWELFTFLDSESFQNAVSTIELQSNQGYTLALKLLNLKNLIQTQCYKNSIHLSNMLLYERTNNILFSLYIHI